MDTPDPSDVSRVMAALARARWEGMTPEQRSEALRAAREAAAARTPEQRRAQTEAARAARAANRRKRKGG